MNRVVLDVTRRSRLFSISLFRHLQTTARACDSVKDSDAIKFSTSDASQWSARESFKNNRDAPRYEPIIISLSLTAVLVYFCILREENDVDEALNRGLFDHLPELEEHQLNVTLKYQKMQGHDTSEVERRLATIRKTKSEIKERRAQEEQK